MNAVPNVNPVELLIAEDDLLLRGAYGNALREIPEIASTIVEDTSSAIKAIEHGSFGIVISDGLYGGWFKVLSSAVEHNAYPVLYSLDNQYLREAGDLGILFFDKVRPFRQVLPQIIKSVYPELNLNL